MFGHGDLDLRSLIFVDSCDEDAQFFMVVRPILVSWILENKEEMGDFPFFIKRNGFRQS